MESRSSQYKKVEGEIPGVERGGKRRKGGGVYGDEGVAGSTRTMQI